MKINLIKSGEYYGLMRVIVSQNDSADNSPVLKIDKQGVWAEDIRDAEGVQCFTNNRDQYSANMEVFIK